MSTEIRGRDSITNSIDPVLVTGNNLHVAQYVWDVNTLTWIKQTGTSGGAGTDVNVTNFPSSQNVVVTSTPTYATEYDEVDATTAYLGKATVGASAGSGSWQIQKLSFSGNSVSVKWADGNTNFDNVWSNRASLSYS